jgi:hypothetical protein
MRVAVKRHDHDLKQVSDLNTNGNSNPHDPHKHASSLQILPGFGSPSADPVVIGTHPHVGETGAC